MELHSGLLVTAVEVPKDYSHHITLSTMKCTSHETFIVRQLQRLKRIMYRIEDIPVEFVLIHFLNSHHLLHSLFKVQVMKIKVVLANCLKLKKILTLFHIFLKLLEYNKSSLVRHSAAFAHSQQEIVPP